MALATDENLAKSANIGEGLKKREDESVEQKKFWTIDDFELGKKIGEGQMGSVYYAREKRSGYKVAIKSIYKSEVVRRCIGYHLRREIEIQSRLRHENILQLFGYFFDDQRIYLILELSLNGSLYDKLQAHGRFLESEVKIYIKQLAKAILYAQKNNVIHRDIKPENILLGQNNTIKLADWGSSVHEPSSNRRTFVGTRDYVTPEMVEGREHSKHTDNWGLGVLTFELLVGKPPFDDDSVLKTYQKISNVNLTFPSDISSDAKDFISGLLRKEPRERLSLDLALEHPFLANI